MRLLQRGDVNTAVLCLLALGDKNDAVEVYVSHKRYMWVAACSRKLARKDIDSDNTGRRYCLHLFSGRKIGKDSLSWSENGENTAPRTQKQPLRPDG